MKTLVMLLFCLTTVPGFAQVYEPPTSPSSGKASLWEMAHVSRQNESNLNSYNFVPLTGVMREEPPATSIVSLPVHYGGKKNPQDDDCTALIFIAPKSGTYGILGLANAVISKGSSGVRLDILAMHDTIPRDLVGSDSNPLENPGIARLIYAIFGPFYWPPQQNNYQDKPLSNAIGAVTLLAGDRLVFVPRFVAIAVGTGDKEDELAAVIMLKHLRITLGRTPFPYRD